MMSDWFAKPPAERGPIPETALALKIDTPQAYKEARLKVWEAYKQGAIQQGWEKAFPAEPGDLESWMKKGELAHRTADLGEKKMPYIILKRGEKPNGGWPLFFCLHGGGANPKAEGPHAWTVNTREWQAQMRLATTVWEAPGLYIIPRMADDREGRWYYGYVQEFIDRSIKQAILFNEVDSNRVYLMGISEGGYTAFRLGSLMADRWAGSCAMAAAEPLRNAPPENLRHLAFRCSIGEKDTMFDRIGLARSYFDRLGELKKEYPDDFLYSFDAQAGRGHDIDYQPGPAWTAKHTRSAVPKGVTWTVIKQHDRRRDRLYWLAIDHYDGKLPLNLTATAKDNNVIEITAKVKGVDAQGLILRVYLNDSLADLSKPVTIMLNGDQAFQGLPDRSMEALIRSTAERGDPKQVFPVQIKLKR